MRFPPRSGPFLLVCTLALTAAAACAPAPDPPNLLLITVDTLRPDRLECYGGEAGVGTTICAIGGDDGVRYDWAFSTAPSTGPSVASILTSQYPSEHRLAQFTVTKLDADAVTLAERLSAAGYATAAVVSNPVLRRERRLDQGFDVYDERMPRREKNRPYWREREAADATDAALAWARDAEGPWFLWIHYQDPHGPYAPPDAEAVRDRPGARRLRPLRDHSGRGGIPAYQTLPGVFSPGAYERRYDDEIRYVDEHIGRLLDGLAPLGETAVLLTSDHGEALGEDGYWFAHGHSLGLDQVRVPLLWQPVRSTVERPEDVPVSLIDVAPTLLAEAGLEAPREFEGRSLSEPPIEDGPRSIFSEHRLRVAVVAGERYYARDLTGFDAPVPDRITGGALFPLPPRSARLGDEDELPPYTRRDPGNVPLEEVVRDHIERAREVDLPDETLDPEKAAELRSLGYLN